MKDKILKKESLTNLVFYFIKNNFNLALTTFLCYFLLASVSYLFSAFIDKSFFSYLENKIKLPLGIWFIIILLFTKFILLLITNFLNIAEMRLRTIIREKFITRMLNAVLHNPKKVDFDESAGEVAYKFRQDPINFCFLMTSVNQIIASSIVAIIAIVLMFSLNFIFTIISIVIVLVNIIILTFLLPKIEQYREQSLSSASKSSGFLTTSISAVQEIKTNNKSNDFLKAYLKRNKNLGASSIKEEVALSATEGLYRLGYKIFTVLMLFFFALNLMNSKFSVSDFSFFTWLSLALSNFASLISQALIDIKQSKVSVRRMQEIYFNYNENDLSETVYDDFNTIEAKDIKIEYTKSNFKIEKSLTINKNDYIMLTGSTASGKSSFIKAVIGLNDFSAGEVFIDNKKIQTPENVFKAPFTVYVPSSPHVFNFTLRENLFLATTEKSQEELLPKVLQITQLETDINNISDGLETEIGNFAGGVSGGQKQRIGIARALLAKPKVLILDDCFTGIDKKIADEIRKEIANIKDLTVIEISNTKLDLSFGKTILF